MGFESNIGSNGTGFFFLGMSAVVVTRDMIKVSSVLNKNTKEFGKQHILDDTENCWNSSQGKPQWIQLQLPEIKITKIEFQFQGGFVPCQIDVLLSTLEKNWDLQDTFYPLDNNNVQSFKTNFVGGMVRFHFPNSTDFFGRIICYSLRIYS